MTAHVIAKQAGRSRPGKRAAWEGLLAGRIIQTDLTMYPGFSGGPLLGADGAVYGLNTSGFAGGVSAAIPVAAIAKSVAALLADGKIQSAYLGIGVQSALLPEGDGWVAGPGSRSADRLGRAG